MNTIHVWPRYIKEFLLTHLGCNSPKPPNTAEGSLKNLCALFVAKTEIKLRQEVLPSQF